jgi:hypothetical protein
MPTRGIQDTRKCTLANSRGMVHAVSEFLAQVAAYSLPCKESPLSGAVVTAMANAELRRRELRARGRLALGVPLRSAGESRPLRAPAGPGAVLLSCSTKRPRGDAPQRDGSQSCSSFPPQGRPLQPRKHRVPVGVYVVAAGDPVPRALRWGVRQLGRLWRLFPGVVRRGRIFLVSSLDAVTQISSTRA